MGEIDGKTMGKAIENGWMDIHINIYIQYIYIYIHIMDVIFFPAVKNMLEL